MPDIIQVSFQEPTEQNIAHTGDQGYNMAIL
jgi:hypothetical protein